MEPTSKETLLPQRGFTLMLLLKVRIMKKFYISLATLLLILSPSLVAQDNTESNATDELGSRRFWQANLPGGEFVVSISSISSVSKHTYVIDGNLKVTEVVVDTTGNSLARFYYITPITDDASSGVAGISERGKELLDRAGERAGVSPSTMVAKQYPLTTHAKTVEFRIASESDLNSLFSSVRSSWMNGRGRKFTIR